ncbi:MAG: alpha,alpha-phosphotrehalase [Erysipelotrichaceae bacterium]|nr:alpha,alpha-phosphotrehalase [Erysipelotrichaceae bacterium]
MSFKDKVVYEIYPKSFKDSNGDGIGDLKGITSKLDYLKLLGIDYIWMTPFFVSPQNDNGYDVADYYHIDPIYGTMDDLDELIKEADNRNIGLMFDMVFNHTSTTHEWFQKALKGDQKYKDYYFFRKEPTNWESKFGGSAWEYVEKFDEYYLHLFDKTQADLNWENPEVRKELIKILNFWIDKGIKGFRFDVINLISKNEFKDDEEGVGKRFYTDGNKMNQYLNELNRESFGKYDNIITVGEMSATTIENCNTYTNPNNHELNMTFNFHHLKVDYKDKEKWTTMPFDFQELKDLFNQWQLGMNDGWNALFWNCHDQPRSISRFGNDTKYHDESAKMLATAIHMQRGTPYIYQGEEIGMTNNYFTDINQYRDVESINYYHILKDQGISEDKIHEILQAKSRDNARSPMQWNKNGGFSDNTPWMEMNPNHTTINIEDNLNNPNSIFYYYQKLIKLRKQYKVISEGSYIPLEKDHPYIYAYKRQYKDEELIVINNFYDIHTSMQIDQINDYKILISNYEHHQLNKHLQIRPYETIVLYKGLKISKIQD